MSRSLRTPARSDIPRMRRRSSTAVPMSADAVPLDRSVRYVIALLAGALLLFASAREAAGQSVAAAATTDGTPRAPRRISWTADRRDYAVGDVITVLLDESTLASATRDQRGSDRQERDMDAGVKLPASGALPAPAIAASVGTGRSTSSDESGIARRNMRFVSEMSVRVVEVDPRGHLKVEGKKFVDLDRNEQEFAFTGWVRPEDVSRDNVVMSARVADARLVYANKGALGKTRGGMIGRIIGMVWP